ncbi:hypothetical protein KQI49_05515 [Virgibacillus sp. MSJ-26]|uniref:hypothetical protein n=1 Tax=Virgibacillus sp. MSJ-26 TaxID=2841522 RepID=UPI001C0F557F|nr:hypothetical protein [Virgibacillus sp. MSJ-26]MBU5466290.1 hypothetical protein [Virgibacillus sp. MSJ-26]
MNKSVDEDQATELRKLISEVEAKDDVKNPTNEERKQEPRRQIDILDLPPRKEIHSKKKSRVHFKLNRSVLRLIVVFLLVAAVIVGVIYLFENDLLQLALFPETISYNIS